MKHNPPTYRDLVVGDVLQDGDQHYFKAFRVWMKNPPDMTGDRITDKTTKFRRRTDLTPPAKDE